MLKIKRLTDAPKHHFFGFHDLKAWNYQDDKILSLEVDIINRPPLPGEKASVGYVNPEGIYIKLGDTNAFNYPQGAREQWIADTNCFVVNNQVGDDWGANIYDTENNSLMNVLPKSVHCLTNDGQTGFTVNYSRLFRLGVYGYIGIEDAYAREIAPVNDGIYIQNIQTKESKLLISIAEVAKFKSSPVPTKGFHHYITHLLLNPDNTRLAFLHRYRLHDGGETTRLMTIGTDGSNLRCLATGFLSHFDWQSNENMVIYGRTGGLETIRNRSFFDNPLIGEGIRMMKKALRPLLKTSGGNKISFLSVKDSDTPEVFPFAQDIFTSDGHPMFNPVKRNWMVNDTYPDSEGVRKLMLYNTETNVKTDLGFFKKIDEKPDTKLWREYTQGVDLQILKLFSIDSYSFTRSGLHCDLHPRWNALGTKIAFDSIHEGTRQLYMCDVGDLIRKS